MAIPRNRTELEHLIVYGIDPKRRVIDFGSPLSSGDEESGSITQLSIGAAVRGIRSMIDDAPKKPITIYMNSGGGSVSDVMLLVDLIQSSTTKFFFYGGGMIQSAATLVMAVCDERYLYENTEIMIHEPSAVRSELPERLSELIIFTEALKEAQEKMLTIYEENSIMPRQFWLDNMRSDVYITSNEAVKLGLAENVVQRQKRGNFRKRRIKHLSNPPSQRTMNSLVKRIYDRARMNPSVDEIKVHVPKKDEIDESLIIDNTPMEETTNESDNQTSSK